MARVPFTLIYAPEMLEHVRFIDRKHHSLIRETIQNQLQHTPTEPTRNKKELEIPAPFNATWELRFGPNNRYRLFYTVQMLDLETDDAGTITILALGEKDGNRLRFAGEEFNP
jgi:mRNA-degrading endonuclease RelE of RelBE toxin-antitoxin system